jgi:hypothetical protein
MTEPAAIVQPEISDGTQKILEAVKLILGECF